jgi:fatty-acyl-CoA synthase
MFAELLADAEKVARALLQRFAPGEHVAIWSANRPEWVLVELGAALAGLTLVTVNPAYLAEELAFVLKQSRARGIIVQDTYRNRDLIATVKVARKTLGDLREVVALSSWADFTKSGDTGRQSPQVKPEDVAQIQYTSGTTGTPKGARLTHRNLANNGRIYARTIGAGETDVWVNPMPLFHTAGCGLCTLGALQTGGMQVLPPGYDPIICFAYSKKSAGQSCSACQPCSSACWMHHRLATATSRHGALSRLAGPTFLQNWCEVPSEEASRLRSGSVRRKPPLT